PVLLAHRHPGCALPGVVLPAGGPADRTADPGLPGVLDRPGPAGGAAPDAGTGAADRRAAPVQLLAPAGAVPAGRDDQGSRRLPEIAAVWRGGRFGLRSVRWAFGRIVRLVASDGADPSWPYHQAPSCARARRRTDDRARWVVPVR